MPRPPGPVRIAGRAGAVAALLLLAAASPTVGRGGGVRGERPGQAGRIFRGRAAYYADRFAGRPTASGEPYDPNELTAAHRSLPFGTRVRVENLRNHRSVEVRINDRGPCGGRGRIIDLSRRAAEELDMVAAGVVPVEILVLSMPGEN